MSVLIEYFLADDDAEAAEVIDWPSGPAHGVPKRLLRRSVPGRPTLAAPGIEPVVVLGVLEELLTGKTFDEQLEDDHSRPILADREEGMLVVRIDDRFVAAVAAAAPERLAGLAEPWAQSEELLGTPAEDLVWFLTEFRDFCARARQDGQHVYCWVCV